MQGHERSWSKKFVGTVMFEGNMQDTSDLAYWCIIQRSPLGLPLACVKGHLRSL